MGFDAVTVETMTLDGVQFVKRSTDSRAAVERAAPNLAPALAGKLTVKTSSSVGTFTLNAGPNPFTPGQIVCLGWSTALLRYGCVVGAVSGLDVPLTGGTGSGLPVANMPGFLGLAVEQPFTVDPSNMAALGLASTVPVTCELLNAGGLAILIVKASDGASYIWRLSSGAANPVGSPIVKSRFSNGTPYPAAPQLAANFS